MVSQFKRAHSIGRLGLQVRSAERINIHQKTGHLIIKVHCGVLAIYPSSCRVTYCQTEIPLAVQDCESGLARGLHPLAG